MTMTRPTSEQITHNGQILKDVLGTVVSVTTYGAKGDGVTDDSAAVEAAITAALAGGRWVHFPSGQYRIGTLKQFDYTGDLYLTGDNATLLLAAGTPVALSFNAQTAATTTMTASVSDGARTVEVASASGIQPGQLMYFATLTPVDSVWSYVKVAAVKVGDVVGTTVHLSEPLNFGFTTAETTLYFYEYASLKMDGINIVQVGAAYRFDYTRLQNSSISNCRVQAYTPYDGDIVFLSACYGFDAHDIDILYGRYSFNVSNATRHSRFDNIFARQARHPIDGTAWCYNLKISRLHAVDCQNSLTSHACFEVHFEDCTDHIEPTSGAGIALRCIGGSVRRCTSLAVNSTPHNSTNGAPLLPAYEYLGQKYDRVYEDIDAPQAVLGALNARTVHVTRCKVRNVSVDGPSGKLGAVSVDSGTTVTDPLSLQRVPVLSPDGPQFLAAPPDTFASINTIKDITGITKANPAVVTAVAHGYSNGDLIRIDGVTGMTEVNKRTFTIANVATDTFELAGENSIGYTTYVSGGKATKGRLAKTFDPKYIPGCGWSPLFRGRMRLRKTGAQLNPLTAITIPVKIVNVMSTGEEPTRQTSITIRAVSSTGGCAAAVYQAYFFINTTTVGTLSSAQVFLPVIGTLTVSISNFRPHYATQVTGEGGVAGSAGANSENYYSFDVVVTASATTDRIQYVDVEFDEVRTGQLI